MIDYRRANRCFLSALIVVSIPLLPELSPAQHASSAAPWSAERNWGGFATSLDLSLSRLGGEAFERVYDVTNKRGGEDFKLSQLTWELHNLYFVGIQGSVTAMNYFRFNAGYWYALNEGSGDMEDLDWLYSGAVMNQWSAGTREINDEDWTHRSTHDDVPVERAYMADLNLEIKAMSVSGITLSGMMGYKRTYWEWVASGGNYVYSTSGRSRDLVGTFSGKGITYEQTYDLLYFGGRLDLRTGIFRLTGYASYSPLVQSTDYDFHHLRSEAGLVFEGEYSGGEYFGTGVAATFTFGRPLAFNLSLAWDYQHIFEIVGDTTITDPFYGITYHPDENPELRDAGSVEMSSSMLSLRLGMSFNTGGR